MKIECVLEKINNPVQLVSKLTSKSSTLPALQGILLQATPDGTLSITATNLDLGIEYKIPVKVEKEGSVLVKSDIFARAISAISDSEKNVTLELLEDVLYIETKHNKISVTTISKDDFPIIPKVEGEKTEIQKQVFVDGVKAVSFTCANTDIKPEIAAVYIYTEPGQMVFVATDSFRLAEKKIKIKSNTNISLLIPNKNIQELVKICEVMGESITLTYSETMMSIGSESIYVTSRIIDGVFPDYRRIIPDSMQTQVSILKQDIVQVLKLTTIFSDAFNQTTIQVQAEENTIECVSKNQNLGSVNQTIPAKVTGDSIQMNFNHKYLQEVLPILSKESINLNFTSINKPLVIKQQQDDSFLYLVMPLNR